VPKPCLGRLAVIYVAYCIYRYLDYHIFLQWAASSLKCLDFMQTCKSFALETSIQDDIVWQWWVQESQNWVFFSKKFDAYLRNCHRFSTVQKLIASLYRCASHIAMTNLLRIERCTVSILPYHLICSD